MLPVLLVEVSLLSFLGQLFPAILVDEVVGRAVDRQFEPTDLVR